MTPDEFRQARRELGLSTAELARILNTDARTVRRYEADNVKSARAPNPIAARVLEWLSAGFRPPQWPSRRD